MTGILSAVSGLFNKAFFLGTLLPVVVFVIAATVFLAPLFPSDWQFLPTLQLAEPQLEVFAIPVLTIVLSALLYNLSTTIRRFFEGHPWRESVIGGLMTDHRRRKISRWIATLPVQSALQDMGGGMVRGRGELLRIRESLDQEFSGSLDLVLPTRLGNVMRAFDYYPQRQYGIDATTMWPRLIAKIDPEYATSVEDAQASLNFMLNSAVLSACLALAVFFAGLYYGAPLSSWSLSATWLITIVVFLVIAVVAYKGATSVASNWGNVFKGAFDLYRWDLLQKLGYKHELITRAEERNLWRHISHQMVSADTNSSSAVDYAVITPPERRTFAVGAPETVEFEVTRGARTLGRGGRLAIVVRVKNIDPQGRPAANVKLTDKLADDWEYVWDSAQLDGAPAAVQGANPFQFDLQNLDHNQAKTVTYQVISRRTVATPAAP